MRGAKIVSILSITIIVFTIALGILIGLAFAKAPIKLVKNKAIVFCAFAAISGIALSVPAWYFSGSLTSISFLKDFSSTLEALPFLSMSTSNGTYVAAVVLIIVLELALALGFMTFVKLTNKKPELPEVESGKKPVIGSDQRMYKIDGNHSSTANRTNYLLNQDRAEFTNEQVLRKDEQAIIELFIYRKITQVVPVMDSSKPEGYFFDGIPQLDWDTKRLRQGLDSLVKRGFLKAELVDELIVCMACGSANVRIKRLCPECMSLRLKKEGLIEHLPCGTVDRKALFESGNGDLFCPKCNTKLKLIGTDYRILPPAYMCLSCNVRSSEPLLAVKCSDCGSTAEFDEEPEIFLYSYIINTELPMEQLQQIKPIEVCTDFFRSLGYTIVSPALVTGKSGTQHLFDMLILGRVDWLESHGIVNASTQGKDSSNTTIEILISSKPIELERIAKIYEMINDIECDSLILAIPGLTENARNYASAYNIKISEGKSIEEALKNSIPEAGYRKSPVPSSTFDAYYEK